MTIRCLVARLDNLGGATDGYGIFAYAWWLILVTAAWYVCAWNVITACPAASPSLMYFLWFAGVGIGIPSALALSYLWYAYCRLLYRHFPL